MSSKVAALSTRVPWWGKIGLKLILSRLPIPYTAWKRLSIFELGQMEEAEYSFRVFNYHWNIIKPLLPNMSCVGMELGPGDSLTSALIARAYGVKAYHLVDVGAFASEDIRPYKDMARFLRERGYLLPDVDQWPSLRSMLEAFRATYHTDGLASLRRIKDHSIDFTWSHTVLQHVKRSEFGETLRQLRRVMRPHGVASHWIDLEDNLGGALNNIRFNDSVWEAPFFAKSGFYTNRIRYSEMLAMFRDAGFHPEVVLVKRWDDLPTARRKLRGHFRQLPDDELRVRCFHVLLKPGHAH